MPLNQEVPGSIHAEGNFFGDCYMRVSVVSVESVCSGLNLTGIGPFRPKFDETITNHVTQPEIKSVQSNSAPEQPIFPSMIK